MKDSGLIEIDTKNQELPSPNMRMHTLAQVDFMDGLTKRRLIKDPSRIDSKHLFWFLDMETNERFYVQTFDDSDKAWCSWIVAEIYKKIGIFVFEHSVGVFDQHSILLSKVNTDAVQITSMEAMQSDDIRNSIVVDVLLLNAKTSEQAYSNVLRGSEGHDYRVVGDMELSSAEMDHLDDEKSDISVVNHQSSLDISDDIVRSQAKKIVERLTEFDIDEIVDTSELSHNRKEKIKRFLKEMRKSLIKRFGFRVAIPIERKIRRTIERKKNEIQTENLTYCFRVDRNHVENQQLNVVDSPNHFVVSFKLVRTFNDRAIKRFESGRFSVSNKLVTIIMGAKIFFIDQQQQTCEFCDAYGINDNGVLLKLSKASRGMDPCRTSQGLVEILIPKDKITDLSDLEKVVSRVVAKYIGIKDLCFEPDPESEQQYKIQRYAWHHKISVKKARKIGEYRSLVRKKVMGDYETFVDLGKYKEYQRIDPFLVYHDVTHVDDLASIIKCGGLLCSTERYRRGININGLSTISDWEKGGGDSIFTRIIPESELNTDEDETLIYSCDTYIIMKPSVLDRTDWWCQNEDTFGDTSDSEFRKRIAPIEYFKEIKRNSGFYSCDNEQMFRYGISLDDIACFAVSTEEIKQNLIDRLHNDEIFKVGDIPLEVFIQVINTYGDAKKYARQQCV